MADAATARPPRQRDGTYAEYTAITPSDTVNIAHKGEDRLTSAIWIGGAGIAQIVDVNGIVVPFTCVAGTVLPVQAKRVNAASTTATLLVALF